MTSTLFPVEHDGSRDAAILRKRADKLARDKLAGAPRKHYLSVAVLAVGSECFGCPVSGIREIVRTPPITRLPGLPGWMLGVCQLRGELVCAVSAAQWFSVESSARPERMAVLEGRRGPLGLVVDHVVAFREVYEDELADELSCSNRGVGRAVMATTKDLLAILDIDNLLDAEHLIVHQEGTP